MRKALLLLTTLLTLVLLASVSLAAEEFDLGGVELGSSSGMDLHGYYEFEYWDTEGEYETFDAHKIVIWMGTDIVPGKVSVSAEFEYEHFPVLEPELEVETATVGAGDDAVDVVTEVKHEGSGEFKVDSAAISITPVKETRIFAGIFYVPFGIEYESYPGDKNKLITRPKVMKKGNIIKGTWTDVGIGIAQDIAGIADLDLYVINGDAASGGLAKDSNRNRSVGARLSVTPLDGLRAGGSYVTGKYDEAMENVSNRWGAHLRIDGKDLYNCPLSSVIIAEVVGGKDENAIAGSATEIGDGATAPAPEDRDVSGYYAQLSFSPLVENLELAFRYGVYDDGYLYNTDTSDDNYGKKRLDNEKSEYSVGVGYELYKNTKLKAEYRHSEYKDEYEDGTVVEDADDDDIIVGLVVNW